MLFGAQQQPEMASRIRSQYPASVDPPWRQSLRLPRERDAGLRPCRRNARAPPTIRNCPVKVRFPVFQQAAQHTPQTAQVPCAELVPRRLSLGAHSLIPKTNGRPTRAHICCGRIGCGRRRKGGHPIGTRRSQMELFHSGFLSVAAFTAHGPDRVTVKTCFAGYISCFL